MESRCFRLKEDEQLPDPELPGRTPFSSPTSSTQELKELESNTMKHFSKMASQIVGCLNFTWDDQSLNPTNKMTVLDTQDWMGTCTEEWGVAWSPLK